MNLLASVQMFAAERAARRAVAAKAGVRGVHARPLSYGQRYDRYTEQTGRSEMTARQRRRAEHKHNRQLSAAA